MTREEPRKVLCRHMTSYGECTLTEEPCVQGPCSLEEPEEWVPVVHGHFVHDGPRFAGGVDWWHCSSCGRLMSGVETRFAYCPWCGAKMDGDGNG